MGWYNGGLVDRTKLLMFDGQPPNGNKECIDLFMFVGLAGSPQSGASIANNR